MICPVTLGIYLTVGPSPQCCMVPPKEIKQGEQKKKPNTVKDDNTILTIFTNARAAALVSFILF